MSTYPFGSTQAGPGASAYPAANKEENFWPTIREQLLGIQPLDPQTRAVCPICEEEVSVTGLPAPQERLRGLVYPCGHLLCEKCYEAMGGRPQVSASCHICRTSLACGRCDIRCEPQVLPGAWQGLEALREVQPTRPEGSLWRQWCLPCEAKNHFQFSFNAMRSPEARPPVSWIFVQVAYDVVFHQNVEDMATFKDRFRILFLENLPSVRLQPDIGPGDENFEKYNRVVQWYHGYSEEALIRHFNMEMQYWDELALRRRAQLHVSIRELKRENPLWIKTTRHLV